MINNYNTNKHGDDIEINIFYDLWASQTRLSEQMQQIEEGFYFFKDYGNFSLDDNNLFNVITPDLSNITGLNKAQFKAIKHDLIRWAINEIKADFGIDFDDIKNLIDDFNYFAHHCENDNQCFIDFIDEVITNRLDKQNKDYYQALLDCDLIDCNFEIIGLSGYSQGDYLEVLYLITDDWETTKDSKKMKEILHHICFDCEIYGIITINEHEFFVPDFLEDYYFWDKDDFFDSFKKSKAVKDAGISNKTLAEVYAMLPESLDYI